jgi:hypothetical protein
VLFRSAVETVHLQAVHRHLPLGQNVWPLFPPRRLLSKRNAVGPFQSLRRLWSVRLFQGHRETLEIYREAVAEAGFHHRPKVELKVSLGRLPDSILTFPKFISLLAMLNSLSVL